jgi:hypothetical protein
MHIRDKAKIILEFLDNYVQVDWNFKEVYLNAIVEGLREIERREIKDNGGTYRS